MALSSELPPALIKSCVISPPHDTRYDLQVGTSRGQEGKWRTRNPELSRWTGERDPVWQWEFGLRICTQELLELSALGTQLRSDEISSCSDFQRMPPPTAPLFLLRFLTMWPLLFLLSISTYLSWLANEKCQGFSSAFSPPLWKLLGLSPYLGHLYFQQKRSRCRYDVSSLSATWWGL